jgi:hypothetical protein
MSPLGRFPIPVYLPKSVTKRCVYTAGLHARAVDNYGLAPMHGKWPASRLERVSFPSAKSFPDAHVRPMATSRSLLTCLSIVSLNWSCRTGRMA